MPNASISTKETTTAAQMHVKSNSENNLRQDTRTMASLNDDDSGSRASNNHNHNHNNNNSNSINNSNSNSNNNNNNNNNNSNTNNNNTNAEDNNSASGDAEIKLKKQTLEQRKQELERLLNEKSWLLQQIQKQETQIINGQHEYLNFNEIFANLAQQYKQEQLGGCGSSILRRKTISTSSKENHNLNQNLNQNQHQNHVNNNNNKNNTNRQSEISNRSSEYDNYPGGSGSVDAPLEIGVGGSQYPHQHTQHAQQQQHATKSAIKKRPLPTTGAAAAATAAAAANLNYIQMQRQQQQQLLQRHVEQQMLQQQQQHAEQQMLQQYAQQQQQQLKLLQQPHYHQHSHQQQQADRERPFLHSPQQHQQQQRQLQLQQQQQQHGQTDAISLYSVNSANVATLRQQHVAPQQQPIIVQCDKYYLSPTHQSYNDGGFIKSSQNIKKYISPMSSPTASTAARVLHVSNNYELQQQQQQQQHVLPLQQQTLHKQQQQQQQQHNQRPLDVISLAPSYASIDAETAHNLRWRSQSSIPHSVSSSVSSHHPPDNKSNSSDMLAHMATMTAGGHLNYYGHPGNLKAKPLDEISISSLNSETQKKSKPKQWMESSLDGPVIRTQANNMDSTIIGQHHHHQPQQQHTQQQQQPHIMDAGLGTNSMRLVQQKSQACRERTKLSSQSMSSARHYSMSAHKNPHASKLLQDDEGRYAKLSQSTSYLNAMETAAGHAVSGYQLDATPLDIPNYKYLPPKPQAQALLTPPPRPPPAGTLGVAASTTTTYEKQLTIAIHSPVGGGGGGGGGSGGGGSGGGSAVATPTNQTLTGGASSLSPDIRIESPKNMTVVQQATFQPYKEVTKPFEMSDFYKYSTKFRQKEPSAHDATN